MTKVPALCTLLLVLSAPTALAESEQPLLITIPRMTADAALQIAGASLHHCRQQGVQIAVTVVDRDGAPVVILRDVLAPALTLKISQGKAYTAASFNTPTSQLVGRFSDDSLATVGNLVTTAGGVPITAAGAILGGVGVSGAPSGDTDEACAQAGVDAVGVDLEMASP